MSRALRREPHSRHRIARFPHTRNCLRASAVIARTVAAAKKAVRTKGRAGRRAAARKAATTRRRHRARR
jgi:hypothetical protein